MGPYNKIFINTIYINEKLENEILIYPNPSNNKINLKIINNNAAIRKILIFDLLGNKCISSNTGNNIDVTNLPTGIYIAKVLTDQGDLYSKPIFKQW